jgi:hypothetical protein
MNLYKTDSGSDEPYLLGNRCERHNLNKKRETI